MTAFLQQIDTWFLIMAVALLGGFFLWAVKYLFNGIQASIEKLGATFKESVDRLEIMIKELFNHRNDHEIRIVRIETRCAVCPENRGKES